MGTHVSGDADAPPTVGEAQAKTYRGRSPRLASRVRPRPGPRGAGNTINPMRIYLVGGCAALGAWAGALAVWPTYRLAVPLGTAPRGDCPRCRVGLPAGWRGWLRLGGRCPVCRTALVAHSWAWPVLAATGFMPHKVDGVLKDACRAVRTPYVRVNRGRPLQCLLRMAHELGVEARA